MVYELFCGKLDGAKSEEEEEGKAEERDANQMIWPPSAVNYNSSLVCRR